jgi:hypothetical protein
MVTAGADVVSTTNDGGKFQQNHPYDRNFYLAMLIAIWAAVLSGFIYSNVQKFAAGKLHYPTIVHVHAVVFVGWLVLFTIQVLAIRSRSVRWHRSFGRLVAAYAVLVVGMGIATGIRTEQLKFGTPDADTRFLSTMFGDMLNFAALIAAGYLWRAAPATHKRLMLMATIVLTDAGLGRGVVPMIEGWWGGAQYWQIANFGQGVWPYIRFQLLPAFALQGMVGVYDLCTRHRLHPAYLSAIFGIALVDLFAGWLYFQPFWANTALRLIGR